MKQELLVSHHEFIIKSNFVAALDDKNKEMWVDEKTRIAQGSYRVDGIKFYAKVTNEYNGETLCHKEIFLSRQDVFDLHDKIISRESETLKDKVDDDLPW